MTTMATMLDQYAEVVGWDVINQLRQLGGVLEGKKVVHVNLQTGRSLHNPNLRQRQPQNYRNCRPVSTSWANCRTHRRKSQRCLSAMPLF